MNGKILPDGGFVRTERTAPQAPMHRHLMVSPVSPGYIELVGVAAIRECASIRS